MKFTAKRLLGAGVIGIAAIVAPISVTALISGPGSIASAQPVACTPVPGDADAVCYVQTSPSNTYQYDTGAAPNPTPQAVTVSTHCATTSGDALLTMCGWVYPTATPSSAMNPPGPSTPPSQSSTVGTSAGSTGVCAVSPCYSLENKTSGNSKSQTDALDFSPGPANVVAGRPFNDAQIQIQRKDNGVTSFPSVDVQLAELDSNRYVLATQDCSLTGGTGATITADTDGLGIGTGPNTPANCTTTSGTLPSSFSTVEVRDMTNSTSITVVGTSTFSLQNQQCFGQTPLQPAGNAIVAPLSITQPGMCKTYTSYTYSDDPNGVQGLNFQATSATPVPFSINITWNPTPECQPTPNNSDPQYSPPLPVCPVTEFTLGKSTYYDQLFCPAPQRTDLVTLTSGQPAVTDSSITAADQGRGVSGSGIPANSYVGTVTPGVSFLLSSSATKQVNVNATTTGSSPLTLAGVAFPQRTDTATVTSGSDSVADSSITTLDQGELVSGPGIPVNTNTYVGTVTQGVSFLLSSSPTSQVNVNATGNGASVNVGVPACVTNKTYTNITVNGTPETVVNEQWSLLADWGSRFG